MKKFIEKILEKTLGQLIYKFVIEPNVNEWGRQLIENIKRDGFYFNNDIKISFGESLDEKEIR